VHDLPAGDVGAERQRRVRRQGLPHAALGELEAAQLVLGFTGAA